MHCVGVSDQFDSTKFELFKDNSISTLLLVSWALDQHIIST